MLEAICAGEMLVDLTPLENDALKINPGGAPANVAVALAKFGHNVAFAGQLGMDAFGKCCTEYLKKSGVQTELLSFTEQYKTSAAIVGIGANGEREFLFYRHPTISADIQVEYDACVYQKLAECKILHFGSVSLSDEPSRSSTLKLVKHMHKIGGIVSFDPNVRLSLWEHPETLVEIVLQALPYVDVLKLTEDELHLLFPDRPSAGAALHIQSRWNIPLILVTRGSDGCFALYQGQIFEAPGHKVTAVDTTGAGDCFQAAVLHWILMRATGLHDFSSTEIQKMIRFANAAGALAVTCYGATTALNNKEKMQELGLVNAHGKE